MDYRFTFEDGTEALAHHGVKGMKWGVWNAETAARYGGGSGVRKRRDKRIAKYEEKAKNATDPEKRINYQRKADYSKELKNPGSTKLSARDLKGRRTLHAVATGLLTYETVMDAVNVATGSIALASVAPSVIKYGAVLLAPSIATLSTEAAVGIGSGIAAVGQYKRARSYHRTALAKDKSYS